jgi:hypothetical protein
MITDAHKPLSSQNTTSSPLLLLNLKQLPRQLHKRLLLPPKAQAQHLLRLLAATRILALRQRVPPGRPPRRPRLQLRDRGAQHVGDLLRGDLAGADDEALAGGLRRLGRADVGVGEVAHVGVDGHAVGRQRGGRGGVDEEVVDPGVGLVEVLRGGDAVAQRAVDHGGSEGYKVEVWLLVLHEVPCWCSVSAGGKSHVDHVRVSQRTCLLGEFLARLIRCAGRAGECLLHGRRVPVFLCIDLHRLGRRISREIHNRRATTRDHDPRHARRELLHRFQDFRRAFDRRVQELAVVFDDAVQEGRGGVDDGVEGGRGLYDAVEGARRGDVGHDAEIEL